MRVGFATAMELKHLHPDDRILRQALERRGVEVIPYLWRDPPKDEALDAMVIRSCWDYVEAPAAFLAWAEDLERQGMVVFNSAATLRWNHDKIYLQELSAKGVPIVPTVFHRAGTYIEDLLAVLRHLKWPDLIIKPAVGNNAAGLTRLRPGREEDLRRTLLGYGDVAGLLVQPFLPTVVTDGEWSLVGFRRELSHSVHKLPKPGDIRVQFTHGGRHEGGAPPAAAVSLAEEVLRLIPDHLYARVDLLRQDGNFLVSEVEMIEPYLHFGEAPRAADQLAELIIDTLGRPRSGPSLPAYEVKLDAVYRDLAARSRRQAGYPLNTALDYRALAPFLDLSINNAGDPYQVNNLLNVHDLEREVIGFFMDLWQAPDAWGYVTSGGTEGNMFGLYAGRELYPDGILYHTADSHYSIAKCARVLRMHSQCVASLPSGAMDLRSLAGAVERYRDRPAIICANIGTTMKGAIDDVAGMVRVLKDAGIERHYIHGDAALAGAMLPFIKGAPSVDFQLPIGSMSVSGHKLIGSPVPCGVVLARRHLVERLGSDIQYIASKDATLSGSRSGLAVLVLWLAIQRSGREGLTRMVADCMEMTEFTVASLQRIGWPAWANDHANTVVIRRPPEALVRKWHLASEDEISHIILMPGMTRSAVRELVADLSEVATARVG